MEFELHDRKFRVKKLSAFGQLHLSRKVAPLLPPLAPLLVEMSKKGKDKPLSSELLLFADLAMPFAEALASMRDQDAEQIFTMTLESVEVQTERHQNVWMPLWIGGAKSASVIELDDAAKLLPIVTRVVIHNLGNFFDGLLTRHGEEIPGSSGDTSLARKIG